jgi:CHAD domain-containing protein
VSREKKPRFGAEKRTKLRIGAPHERAAAGIAKTIPLGYGRRDMTPGEIIYAIDGSDAARDALAGLRERYETRDAPREIGQRTYHDTFDWRVYRRGGVLRSTACREGWLLQWLRLDWSPGVRSFAERLPSFATDLPERLAGDLGRIIEMRRLLPVARVDVHGEVVAILDRRRKTVARVRLERGTVSPGDGRATSHPLPDRLRAVGVRGYESQLDALLRFLDGLDGLARQGASELDQLLAAMGREPCSYSSKLELSLDPDMRADEAAKRILAALLETMLANEDGTRRDLDTEFLHDFRVSIRRTRSCLGQLQGVFPEEVTRRFAREFAWLGGVTGPTRDLDVYLLNMVDYRARLPAESSHALEPLEHHLRERQVEEQRRLARTLGAARYRKLVRDWAGFLEVETPTAAEGEAAAGARPALDVATERILRAYRRVRKRGAGIDEQTPVEVLHRLRIDCKKLRYLLEFFRSLYPAERVVPLIRSLKRLQDDLGDLNDVGVQTGELRGSADELLQQGSAATGTLLAMGRLQGQIEEREKKLRNRLLTSVAAFVGNEVRSRFRRLRS